MMQKHDVGLDCRHILLTAAGVDQVPTPMAGPGRMAVTYGPEAVEADQQFVFLEEIVDCFDAVVWDPI